MRRLFGGIVACLTVAAVVPALAAAGSISGTVSAEGGGPIQAVEVCAIPAPEAFEDTCDETDSAGRYELENLPAYSYRLWFWAGRHNLRYVSEWYDNATVMGAELIHLGASQDAEINAALAEGGSIAGTVTDESNGQRIAGLTACADLVGSAIRCSRSNADGEYLINGLPSGVYNVEYEGLNEVNYLREFYEDADGLGKATDVEVIAPLTTAGIDAVLAPGAQILGHLTDTRNGGPAPDIFVCAYEQEPGEYQECDMTDSAGNYALRGLPAATYLVAFEPQHYPHGIFAKQWWQGASSMAEATPIAIAPPETRAGIDGHVEGVHWPPPPPEPELLISPPPPPPAAKKPLPKCKKNFRRKMVKGKSRCVRKHKRHHAANKNKGKSKARGAPKR